MSERATMMKALIQNHDGFAEGGDIYELNALDPYVSLQTVEVPKPVEGQVLIKTALASVNPSDEMFIQGLYGQRRQKGKPAGFEGVGEVIASGGGAACDKLIGKRVAFAVAPDGSGSWAQYSIAQGASCIPLMEGVQDVDGAAMIVNPLTALAMFSIVREEGTKAFIVTAGGSQLCKLMFGVAREEGYRPIAIVRRDDQIELLKKAGACHVLNETSPDYEEQLAAVIRQEKPRIFLDAVTGPLASRIFTLMPKRARWIIYGRLDVTLPPIEEPGQMIFMHKRIEGFWLSEWMRVTDPKIQLENIVRAQKNFASGVWGTDVTATISLEDASEKLVNALKQPNGKVFIKP